MKKKDLLSFGAAAAMVMFAPQVIGADAEVKADVDLDKPDRQSEVDVDVDRKSQRTPRTDGYAKVRQDEKVRASNKATGLIGMEVRNQQKEKLGEIKDLVMDLESGKISYAVLAVGGFLGIGEKLIALPPESLNIADDNSHLLLNADKTRIQAAPGFAATAWPSVDDPEIRKFWRSTEATGAPASSETRRERGDLDVDVDRENDGVKGEVKVDADGKDKLYTDAEEEKKAGDKKVKVDIEKD